MAKSSHVKTDRDQKRDAEETEENSNAWEKKEFIMAESKINTSEAQQFHEDESKLVFKSPRKLTLIIFYFISSAHIHLQEPVIISLT